VIPFLPFALVEQAVIVHKYLRELTSKVRRPISLAGQLIGNVILHIPREPLVCSTLAKDCYDSDTGARSLEAGVKRQIEHPLLREYLASNSRIQEDQPVEEFLVDVDHKGRIKVERIS
jgi:ATP-dependent Clp protease ATP-binding subunit ClpA